MDKEELWGETLNIILSKVEENDPKNAFLNMLKPFGVFGDQLVLTTNNQQVETWVKKQYLGEITSTVAEVYGSPLNVNIQTMVAENDDTKQQMSSTQPAQYAQQPMSNNSYQPIQQEQPTQPDWGVIYAGQQEQKPSYPDQWQQQQQKNNANRSGKEALFSKCTFDTFVVGSSNNFARGAALAVAEQPGMIYNPLFIYGSSGLGKTHLLVAIANYINQNFPRMAVCYVSANEFLNDYVEALPHNNWSNFNEKYHKADVLLVDDVQYLAGKKETINQLFNIFNEMTGQNKQIVLSADRAPKDIDMDERVRSRFMQGLLADIKAPDYETRLAIIKKSYERMLQTTTFFGTISDEVLSYIAEISNSNIREMEGAIIRLMSNMNLCKKQNITTDEAAEVLQDFFPDIADRRVTIEAIQSEVERFFNVTHDDLISSKRSKGLTAPRHVAIYLSRAMTEESLENIGKKFGGRDHTTVMYSVSKIESEQKENRTLFDQIEQLRTRLVERY